MDLFVEPLRVTCTAKVKQNAVKQEYEKQDELKRSALRALSALAAIPKAGTYLSFKSNYHFSKFVSRKCLQKLLYFFHFQIDLNPQMADFLKYIQNTSDLQTAYQAVQKDSLNALNINVVNSSLILDNSMDQS